MANLLPLFSLFDDVDISYKTIERAYSDPLVKMIIHNMFVILVKRKGIKQADLAGDGTGYSLTITKHYRSVREKAGEAVKRMESQRMLRQSWKLSRIGRGCLRMLSRL